MLIAAAILIGLAVIIRLVLDPIASHYTRRALNEAEGVSGDFLRVHVTLLPPGYEIRRLKIVEEPRGGEKNPLFYVDTARVGLDWRALFHAELAASLTLEEPKVIVVRRPAKKTGKKEPAEVPDFRPALQKVIPARVDCIDVVDGEVLLRDMTVEGHPEFWLHHIDATVQNIATRRKLAAGKKATVACTPSWERGGGVRGRRRPVRGAAGVRRRASLRDWRSRSSTR